LVGTSYVHMKFEPGKTASTFSSELRLLNR